MLIDSHCHLDFQDLSGQLDAVLGRACASEVFLMQTICTRISDFSTILKMSEENLAVYCSVGNHPVELAKEGLVTAQEILDRCVHPKVIGIGETGLDYYRDGFDKGLQQKSFIAHIVAAQESRIPLIIHTRAADEDTVAILKEMAVDAKFSGVIHCFTSTQWLAEECLKLGLYISCSGVLTFKNATDIQAVFATLPEDRILIETDSPFLSPVPLRGKVNEPSHLVHIAKFLAELRGVSYEKIAALTTQNFFNLFTKAVYPEE